ncbi:hypothetical protein LN042_03130 [Kitasatospora sp. RB6PN24]|uniref:hypothetical protein n=1 Tax=Kitasatospora humi TaxID=2893891 RepID=UPI001E551608|nr:hypothetical protein [Kitasatospora humi]MCC9306109.1 hypothetical protein [Kitasatospora humi]
MSTEGTHKAQDCPRHPGDVGRGVLHRRRRPGLGREEVAAGSGTAVTYLESLKSLESLESHADPGPGVGGTRRTRVRISPRRVTGHLIRTAGLLP